MHNLPSEWKRPALPLFTLALLAHQDAHGYFLMQELGRLGFENIKGGTLYPLLSRQEEAGLISYRWEHNLTGPARKVFSITVAGERELSSLWSDWHQLEELVGELGQGTNDRESGEIS